MVNQRQLVNLEALESDARLGAWPWKALHQLRENNRLESRVVLVVPVSRLFEDRRPNAPGQRQTQRGVIVATPHLRAQEGCHRLLIHAIPEAVPSEEWLRPRRQALDKNSVAWASSEETICAPALHLWHNGAEKGTQTNTT